MNGLHNLLGMHSSLNASTGPPAAPFVGALCGIALLPAAQATAMGGSCIRIAHIHEQRSHLLCGFLIVSVLSWLGACRTLVVSIMIVIVIVIFPTRRLRRARLASS